MIENLQCISLLNYSALPVYGIHMLLFSCHHFHDDLMDFPSSFDYLNDLRGQKCCNAHFASDTAASLGQNPSGSCERLSLERNASVKCSEMKRQINSSSEPVHDTH